MRLQDVAKKANVSVATASRVVNGLDTVSANTRRRVLAVLEELNYTPNLQARSLVSGQSRTIGIIVSNLDNPFFVEIFSLLETEAHRQGYEVLLANTNYQSEQLARAIRMMTGRQVAGLNANARRTPSLSHSYLQYTIWTETSMPTLFRYGSLS